MATEASLSKNAVLDISIARFKNVLDFDLTCHSGIPSVCKYVYCLLPLFKMMHT